MTNEKNGTVLYEVDGSIARLMLNRPEKRNALNRETVEALKEGLRRADAEGQVRSIILTGNGPDFCAGADLAALQQVATSTVRDNLADARALLELFLLIRNVAVPVIAAVKGRALAGGCGLALACDVVLAARSARFGFPEVRIGFVPAMVMAIVRRNVSEKRAFELLTTANEISAEEAHRLGFINSVFDEGAFDSDCADSQPVAPYGVVAPRRAERQIHIRR